MNYSGAAQNVCPGTYTNLTVSGTGGKTIASGKTVTVNGIDPIENGTNANTYTGTLTYGPNATLQYNAGSSARSVLTAEWPTSFTASGGVIVNGSGGALITLPSGSSFTMGSVQQHGAVWTINNGGTLKTSSDTITFWGNLIVNSGGSFTNTQTGSSITISGTMANQIINLTSSVSGGFNTTATVTFSKTSGSAAIVTNGGSYNVTIATLTLSGSSGTTLQLGTGVTYTVTNAVTIPSGMVFDQACNGTLVFSGSLTVTGQYTNCGADKFIRQPDKRRHHGQFRRHFRLRRLRHYHAHRERCQRRNPNYGAGAIRPARRRGQHVTPVLQARLSR